MIDVILSIFPFLFHFLIGQIEGEGSPAGAADRNFVSSPNLTGEFPCGYPHVLAVHYGEMGGKEVPIYHLNKTSEKLDSEGFSITVDEVFDDILYKFSFTNGSYSDTMEFTGHGGLAAVGGKPAAATRAYYMAQIGLRKGDTIRWLCDGALINKRWVLSAAHCFIDEKANPNIIRLGDYDVSVPPERGLNFHGKFIEEYYIQNVIFHPEYNGVQWYNDLVLIPLSRPTPSYSKSINPVCLPWDTTLDLLGKEVTLTGWGATVFKGPKTPLLQEVNLKVYDTSICNQSYSSIENFKLKYPAGLTSNETLCVGWTEGGKDACGGDSGAPLVYDRKSDGSIIMIGIVSSGYGCGKKGFPGLYVPINNRKYLQWIKDTAFKDYV